MRVAELDPVVLFRHFDALVQIPRGSGFEGGVREYLLSFAREHGFDSRVDGAGNVVIPVRATPGREKAPVIVLQGHMDMVCEKRPDVAHDFRKDPIPAFVDGDHVRTRGTTLGADNGIGVAAALAVAEDPDCAHGPLELLFTVDEETGLTGAFHLDGGMLHGRTMLNLDSEDEGTLFVGCAGGGNTAVTLHVRRVPVPAGYRPVTVRVEGLKGGHSGLDIAANRGNALKILARALAAAEEPEAVHLAALSGGSKHNAIPRDAHAAVYVAPDRIPGFLKAIHDFDARIRTELGAADPGVAVRAVEEPNDHRPVAESGRIVRLLLALPSGPIAMSLEIPGLVETSTNLAVAGLNETECTILCSSRSSVASAIEAVRLGIRAAGELAGGEVLVTAGYPGWRPDLDSKVLGVARDVWKQVSGAEAKVTAIHAGLECGVIGERVPGMDMISFGPDIRGAHSPDECVSVPSTARFYGFLKAVLGRLAQ